MGYKVTSADGLNKLNGFNDLHRINEVNGMSAPESYRLFVAIEMPEEIKKKLAAIQAQLQGSLPERGVTWTKAEQLHLTLKFLGNVEVVRIDALAHQLDAACRQFSPLRLRAQGVGAFPDLRFPRVIWVGLTDALGKLVEVQRVVEAVTRDFTTEKPDERFSAHVTLGRAKRLDRRQAKILSTLVSELAHQFFGEWVATQIELLRSELSPQGAKHSKVATFSLQQTP